MRTSGSLRTTRALPARWRGRCDATPLPQPGLDDDLREVPAVLERLRLLGLTAFPRDDRDRYLGDLRPVAQRLDEDLARPELILLEDEHAQEVRTSGAEPAGDVGDTRAREQGDRPREEMHAEVADRRLLLEVAEQA